MTKHTHEKDRQSVYTGVRVKAMGLTTKDDTQTRKIPTRLITWMTVRAKALLTKDDEQMWKALKGRTTRVRVRAKYFKWRMINTHEKKLQSTSSMWGWGRKHWNRIIRMHGKYFVGASSLWKWGKSSYQKEICTHKEIPTGCATRVWVRGKALLTKRYKHRKSYGARYLAKGVGDSTFKRRWNTQKKHTTRMHYPREGEGKTTYYEQT